MQSYIYDQRRKIEVPQSYTIKVIQKWIKVVLQKILKGITVSIKELCTAHTSCTAQLTYRKHFFDISPGADLGTY